MASRHLTEKSREQVYTFFDNSGRIVVLPTRWMRSLVRNNSISSKTAELYAKNMSYFLEWLEGSQRYARLTLNEKVRSLRRVDAEDYFRKERSRGLDPVTVRNREATFKTFVRWTSTEKGLNNDEILERVYRGDEDDDYITTAGYSGVPKSVTPKEIISLLGGYHNECERCLAHLVFDTGLRISEAQRLTRNDLPDLRRYSDGTQYLPLDVLGSKGRGGAFKKRIAIISRPVLARIQRYHNYPSYRFAKHWTPCDPEKPCFLTPNSRKVKYSNAASQLKSAAERAGLNADDYHYHKLRH